MSAASERPRGRRRWVAALFWVGVGIAPLAALLLVIGQGVGPLRAAAVLSVLSVVVIGLSVTLREDTASVREDFQEQVAHEVDLVRSDVDALRRGVEQTVHRELERVRGELEAARRDSVLRAESTRLARITGDLPAPDDHRTVEPIREEYRERVAPSPAWVADVAADPYGHDPVRVVAARVDSTVVARDDGYGYEATTRYETATYEAPGHDSREATHYETATSSLTVYAGPDPDRPATGRRAARREADGRDRDPATRAGRRHRYDDEDDDPSAFSGDILEVTAGGTYSLGGRPLTEPEFGAGPGFGAGSGFAADPPFGAGRGFAARPPLSRDARTGEWPALPEGTASRRRWSPEEAPEPAPAPWDLGWSDASHGGDAGRSAGPADRDEPPSRARHGEGGRAARRAAEDGSDADRRPEDRDDRTASERRSGGRHASPADGAPPPRSW